MIDRFTLGELAAYPSANEPVVSLFLNVDGRDRSPVQFAEVAHQLTRSAHQDLQTRSFRPDVAERVGDDLDRVTRFVGAQYEPNTAKGLALFACASRRLWLAHEVSCPMADEIRLDPRPDIRPLARILNRHPPTLVALVDREKARLFVVELGEISELPMIEHDVAGRIRPQSHYGLSDRSIERHVDEHIRQHIVDVAKEIDGQVERVCPRYLLIGGTPDVVPQLERALSSAAANRLGGRINGLMIIASADEVMAAASEQLQRIREKDERALLDELRNYGTGAHRAVFTLDSTLEALYRKAVRVLVVADLLSRSGLECKSCGRLYVSDSSCPACGSAERHAFEDLIGAVIGNAVRQDAVVEFVGSVPDKRWEGLGALLRYPETTANTGIGATAAGARP